MAGSEYKKMEEGDKVVFTVTPASALVNKGARWMIGGWVFLFGGIALLSAHFFAFLLVIGVAALIWKLSARDIRPNEHKLISAFKVSPDTIHKDGKTFNKDDIHRLIVKNGITNHESGSTYIETRAHGAMAAAHAVSQEHKQRVSAIAHSLNLETGGKSYLLAGGMDETTAYGLMSDVSRIIGFAPN